MLYPTEENLDLHQIFGFFSNWGRNWWRRNAYINITVNKPAGHKIPRKRELPTDKQPDLGQLAVVLPGPKKGEIEDTLEGMGIAY